MSVDRKFVRAERMVASGATPSYLPPAAVPAAAAAAHIDPCPPVSIHGPAVYAKLLLDADRRAGGNSFIADDTPVSTMPIVTPFPRAFFAHAFGALTWAITSRIVFVCQVAAVGAMWAKSDGLAAARSQY